MGLPDLESGGGSGVGRCEERLGPFESGVYVAGCEQSEVADFGEALGQDMQQEAANEFERGQGLGVAVLGVEGDGIIIYGDEALVGDTDPVGIATEVFEDGAWAVERLFAIDDPIGIVQLVHERGEALRGIEPRAAAGEFEPPLMARSLEGKEKLAAEEPAEDPHREEETGLGGDPCFAVRGKSAGGDDNVEMGMEVELAGPGVQHGSEAEQTAQVLWVGSELEQGFRGRLEENVIDDLGIAQGQRPQLGREREDRVEISCR